MQPIHLVLYGFLNAPAIAATNPLYSIAASWFLIPGYKWFVKMFDGGSSETAKGEQASATGTALVMSAMNKMGSLGAGDKKKAGKNTNGSDSDDEGFDDSIFMPRDDDGDLLTFGGESNNDEMPSDEEGGDTTVSGPNMGEPNDDEPNQVDPDTGVPIPRDPNGGQQVDNPNSPEGNYNFSDQDEADIQRQLERDMESYRRAGGTEDIRERRERELRQQMASGNWSHPRGNRVQRAGEKVRKIANHPATRFIGRGAAAGGKKVLSGVIFGAKKATQVGMAAAGTTIGAVATLGTGQGLDKAITNGIAGGVAGNVIGRNVANAVESIPSGISGLYKSGRNTVDDIRNAYNEEFLGYDVAREKRREIQTERARKAFYKDATQIRKCRSMASEIPNFSGNLKDVQDAVFDMKKAGVKDDKLITNTLKAEYKRDGKLNGKTHKQFVDMASFSQQKGLGYNDMAEAKNRDKLETMIQGKVSGDRAQGEAERTFAQIWGAEKIYEQHGKLGKQSRQQRQQENNGGQAQNTQQSGQAQSGQQNGSQNGQQRRGRRRQRPQ